MKRQIKNLLGAKNWERLGGLKLKVRAWGVNYDPKKCMEMFYKDVFKKEMDWNNPKDLIEKINWLQLNTDTSLWTKCADKYEVREYVKGKGLGNILNELYGVWDKAEDIEWDKLPNQFVLKTTQGCGEVLLVKDKRQLDFKKTTKQLNKWLKEKYGLLNGQTHYTRIKPRIIAEKLLENTENPNASITDYKIWCFNGSPSFFLLVHDRIIGKQYLCSTYDLNWINTSSCTLNPSSEHFSNKPFTKPTQLHRMIEVAKILSQGFPEVRVDLYATEEEVIFGEMTFTTGFGYFRKAFYRDLGEKVILPS